MLCVQYILFSQFWSLHCTPHHTPVWGSVNESQVETQSCRLCRSSSQLFGSWLFWVFFSVFADEYFITAGCLSKQRSSSSLQGEDEPPSPPRPPTTPPLSSWSLHSKNISTWTNSPQWSVTHRHLQTPAEWNNICMLKCDLEWSSAPGVPCF